MGIEPPLGARPPRVSVIIVNYNGGKIIGPCLNSLLDQTFTDFETIVVDNASNDGSPELIDRFIESAAHIKRPSFKLVRLATNTGFAGGNNEGLKHAAGEYIALLNADMTAAGNWLEKMVDLIESKPECGMVASRIVIANTDDLDSAGDGFSTSLTGFKTGQFRPASMYTERREVFGICGGAALISRKMIDVTGFFDEDFFLIFEDADLNLRARWAGYKTWYEPDAHTTHAVRSTIGKNSRLETYYSVRNAALARMKNIPPDIRLKTLPAFIAGQLIELWHYAVTKRRPITYIRAKYGAMMLARKMKHKRREILARRKISIAEFTAGFTPGCEADQLKRRIARIAGVKL